MTQHELKLNTKYFDSINNGIRTFDIRKANPKRYDKVRMCG